MDIFLEIMSGMIYLRFCCNCKVENFLYSGFGSNVWWCRNMCTGFEKATSFSLANIFSSQYCRFAFMHLMGLLLFIRRRKVACWQWEWTGCLRTPLVAVQVPAGCGCRGDCGWKLVQWSHDKGLFCCSTLMLIWIISRLTDWWKWKKTLWNLIVTVCW